jgi:hypothetical protein
MNAFVATPTAPYSLSKGNFDETIENVLRNGFCNIVCFFLFRWKEIGFFFEWATPPRNGCILRSSEAEIFSLSQ